MTFRITEIYFGGKTYSKSQQWVEIFNEGPDALNLRKLVLDRYDGKKSPFRAWVTTLPDEDFFIEPQQYGIIAQRLDLGQKLCSEHKVIVASEGKMSFKSKGPQTFCIFSREEDLEVCVSLADYKSASKCELIPGLFASPGLPEDFCEQKIASGWHACAEPVVEAAKTVEAQTANIRQTPRHATGCQMTSLDGGFEFFGLIWVLGRVTCRSLFKFLEKTSRRIKRLSIKRPVNASPHGRDTVLNVKIFFLISNLF